MELLYINSVLVSQTLKNGGFGKLLAGAKLLYDTRLLVLSFEFLKGAFDVLTLFNWYNNHFFEISYIIYFDSYRAS